MFRAKSCSFPGLMIIAAMLLLMFGCGGTEEQTEAKYGDLATLAMGKTDKAMNWHGFIELYEQIFFPLRDKPIKFLEIGIFKGGSIEVWQDYFPKAKIYGIDIRDYSELDSARVKTGIADQADREQLAAFIEQSGKDFDVILDDGGHKMWQQQISFGFLFKYLKPGGFYIIEDVHTSFPDRYVDFGVEEGEQNTTYQMIKKFIRSAVVESEYLTPEEIKYLAENIEYCNLSMRNNEHRSTLCIFKKKLR